MPGATTEQAHARLLAELYRVVANNEAMPTMTEIVERTTTSRARLDYAFVRLLADGVIQVWGQRVGAGRHGIIICATGQRSA